MRLYALRTARLVNEGNTRGTICDPLNLQCIFMCKWSIFPEVHSVTSQKYLHLLEWLRNEPVYLYKRPSFENRTRYSLYLGTFPVILFTLYAGNFSSECVISFFLPGGNFYRANFSARTEILT